MGVFSEVAERFRDTRSMVPVQPGPTLNDILLALSKAMDLLEGKPLRSSMKVAIIAGSIATHLAMPQREKGALMYAALLHDIGLASLVSDIYPHLPPGFSEKALFQNHALLNARVISSLGDHALSGELFDILRRHPLKAQKFIESIGMSSDVSELVGMHHELMDGSGYPLGLTKDQIPLGARILAFADVVENVLDYALKEGTGIQARQLALDDFLAAKTEGRFDPAVVSAFQKLLATENDFIVQLSTLNAEKMVRQLLPERSTSLDGMSVYRIAQAVGRLTDNLMPAYKAGRSHQVALMAVRLAETLNIGNEQCGELVLAALMMDVGHLATPAHILFKTGPLTAQEKLVIHDHPRLTHEVLKNIPTFENVGLWASEHHERINGQGYPAQRRGNEISVGGRILALADVFNALTSRRPYRTHAHDPMDAIPVIGQGRSILYDNALVTQLRNIILASDIPLLVKNASAISTTIPFQNSRQLPTTVSPPLPQQTQILFTNINS